MTLVAVSKQNLISTGASEVLSQNVILSKITFYTHLPLRSSRIWFPICSLYLFSVERNFLGFYSKFFGTSEAEISTRSLEDTKHAGFLDKAN